MSHFENPLRLVRQLKGAPLACLVSLSLAGQPVTARWLCAVTGYGAHAITTALEALETLGFAACNSHRSAWRLLAGVQQLPLGPDLLAPPDRENRVPSLEEDSSIFKDFSLSLDLEPNSRNSRPDREKRDRSAKKVFQIAKNAIRNAENALRTVIRIAKIALWTRPAFWLPPRSCSASVFTACPSPSTRS